MKTELEKIMSVSGKGGLFKVISGGKTHIIVEALVDGKRHAFPSTQRISTLNDISMFTSSEDVPLRKVLETMKTLYNMEQAPDSKSEGKVLKAEMKKILPEYDEERVYDSDIRKLFAWYNMLQAKEMLDFAEPKAEEKEEQPAAAEATPEAE